MLIAMIAAMAKNRTIGRDGQMPWHLPNDLKRFRQLTMGQTLLMGRKTYQSIGKPLSGRQSLVLSRDAEFSAPGCKVVTSLEAALDLVVTEQLFICGGEEVYLQALPLAEKICLTELLLDVAGDRFFPQIPAGLFETVHSEELFDAGHPCRYSVLQRV